MKTLELKPFQVGPKGTHLFVCAYHCPKVNRATADPLCLYFQSYTFVGHALRRKDDWDWPRLSFDLPAPILNEVAPPSAIFRGWETTTADFLRF